METGSVVTLILLYSIHKYITLITVKVIHLHPTPTSSVCFLCVASIDWQVSPTPINCKANHLRGWHLFITFKVQLAQHLHDQWMKIVSVFPVLAIWLFHMPCSMNFTFIALLRNIIILIPVLPRLKSQGGNPILLVNLQKLLQIF